MNNNTDNTNGEDLPLSSGSNHGGNTVGGSDALQVKQHICIKAIYEAYETGDFDKAMKHASTFESREQMAKAESGAGITYSGCDSVMDLLDSYCTCTVHTHYCRGLAELGLSPDWKGDKSHVGPIEWTPVADDAWIKNVAATIVARRIHDAIHTGAATLKVHFSGPAFTFERARQLTAAIDRADLKVALVMADRFGSRHAIVESDGFMEAIAPRDDDIPVISKLDALCTEYYLNQVNTLLATMGCHARQLASLGQTILWTPGLTVGAIRQKADDLVNRGT